MTELQDELETSTPLDEEAELAPAEIDEPEESTTEVVAEKVTFDEHQQKVIDDLAAKKTRQIRDAQRENERIKQELTDLRAKIPEESRPVIPPMPDSFDDDFDTKLKLRDSAIADAARFDERSKYHADQAADKQRKEALEKQASLSAQINAYAGLATKLGVSKEELSIAGGIVADGGIHEDLAGFIIGDDKGPLITKYLASNPVVFDAIRDMSPVSAAAYIASEIKPRLNSSNRPPPPAETLAGGAPRKTRGPKGATFE